MRCDSVDEMDNNSFQEIKLEIYESDGVTPIDATLYAECEYRIFATDTCVPLFSASIGSGISISGTDFILTTQTTDITFSTTEADTYTHTARLARSAGELEGPVMDRGLIINDVCPA